MKFKFNWAPSIFFLLLNLVTLAVRNEAREEIISEITFYFLASHIPPTLTTISSPFLKASPCKKTTQKCIRNELSYKSKCSLFIFH